MRRLLTFPCEGATLAGSLDAADGGTGVLLVTGGSQTRVGSHRMYERLAARLAAAGHPAFRYDRRGVGDSDGDDPGYEGSGPDIAAAVAAFRAECPQVTQVIGFGLCDGATALALHGRAAGVDRLILVNPWLVEAESDAPPAAAVKAHYRERLTSVEGWRHLLSGAVSWRKLLGGIGQVLRPEQGGLAERVAMALRGRPAPALLLATGDATAIAAEAEWRGPSFAAIPVTPVRIDTDSHTFARPGDAEALLAAVLGAIAKQRSA